MMRRTAKVAAPLLAAVLIIASVWVYGPTLAGRAAYAVAAAEHRAARAELAKLSKHDHMSTLFRAVAKAVKPSVVVVHVKQKIEYTPAPDMDEFFRRFFGEDAPFRGRPMPRREQPAPRREQPAPKREFFRSGIGSGVVIDAKNGYVLTNWHVVRNADKVEVILSDERRLGAEWVRTDAATDLAIIKVKPDRLIDAPLGNSDAMQVGDWVLAIGAPEGLPQTVTAGIISAKGRVTPRGGYQNFLQTDAAINHGNSGGPLVNMRGEVVGINSAIVSRTGVNEGIGLSVPSNMAKGIMRQLVQKGKVVRGYLGVRIQDPDDRLARSFNLPHRDGALVGQVLDGGPAAKAGLQIGDFILAVNGKRVRSVNELRNTVALLAPGKTYPVRFLREGKEQTLKVKLENQPASMTVAFGDTTPSPDTSVKEFGLKVAAMTEELAQKYRYPRPVEGVIITAVEPNSDADEQGLAEGMVILRVQGRKVTTPAEFRRAISGKNAQRGVRLHVTDRTGAGRFVFLSPTKK
jgi:serine protease Do